MDVIKENNKLIIERFNENVNSLIDPILRMEAGGHALTDANQGFMAGLDTSATILARIIKEIEDES